MKLGELNIETAYNTQYILIKTEKKRSINQRHYCLKFSTATITTQNEIVPWLASEGPLTYSPFCPPETNYFFLYNFILPKIFREGVNLKEHYWFGDYSGNHGHEFRLLQDFWNKSRDGNMSPVLIQNVSAGLDNFEAPIAVFKIYPHTSYQRRPYYLFIQHGSYLLIPAQSQPLIESGFVLLYRGIGLSNKFRIYQMPEDELLLNSYKETLKNSLLDSVISFNTIHSSIHRAETCHLLDSTHLFSKIFCSGGNINNDWRKFLTTTQQSYTLEKEIAKNKFGPSYVTFKTPLTNIRICTYFAGEREVKILSLDKLIPIKTVKCQMERASYKIT